MKIDEIRIQTAYTQSIKPNKKTATRDWLRSLCKNYPIALTLTLKQTYLVKNERGVFVKKLTRLDCDAIAERFANKLSSVAYGNAYKRHNKKLNYLIVVEGGNTKNLHLHMAIGNLPTHIKFWEFDNLVKKAKCLVDEVDEQHMTKIADSGWTDYITKELSKEDTSNVLWHLA